MSPYSLLEIAGAMPAIEIEIDGEVSDAAGLVALAAINLFQATDLGVRDPLDLLLVDFPELDEELDALDDFTPLAALREALTEETISILPNDADDGYVVDALRKDEDKSKPRIRPEVHDDFRRDSGITSGRLHASEPLDLEVLHPEMVTTIHISKQGALTIRTVAYMLETFPNLEAITAPPTVFGFKFAGPTTIRQMLDEAGITYQKGYLANPKQYAAGVELPGYLKKKDLYHRILVLKEDADLFETVENMEHWGLIDLDLLHQYLGGKRTSLTKIADERDVNYRDVVVEISALLCLIGYEYGDLKITDYIIARLNKYYKILAAVEDDETWKQLHESYGVVVFHQGMDEGSYIYPPDEMIVGNWDTWQQIMLSIIDEDENLLWENLEHEYPQKADAIRRYYQIEEHRGVTTTLEELRDGVLGGRGNRVTGERIRQMIKTGLEDIQIVN